MRKEHANRTGDADHAEPASTVCAAGWGGTLARHETNRIVIVMNTRTAHRAVRFAPLLLAACGLSVSASAQQAPKRFDAPRLVRVQPEGAVRVRVQPKAGRGDTQVRVDRRGLRFRGGTLTTAGDSARRISRDTGAGSGTEQAEELDGIIEYGQDFAGAWDDNPTEFAWTDLVPSPDTRMVYVSSSEGDDANSGLSPDDPVRTIAKGLTLMRNGYPDWLLLKGGDTFRETIVWNRNGRSAEEPCVLTSYDVRRKDGRPVVAPGPDAMAIDISAHERNYVAFVGIDFVAPEEGTTKDGIRIINDIGHDILIEDCLIDGFRNGLNIQRGSKVRIRANVIVDSAAPSGGHSQGLFVYGTDDLLVEGNVFDHNGWRDDGTADPTIFNHNCYIRAAPGDPVVRPIVRGNIFARASSFGCTLSSDEPGGIIDPVVEDNLFVGNGNGFVHGGGASYAIVNTTVRGNVFTHMGRTLNNAPQSFGLLAECLDGGLIEQNYFISNDYGGETFAVKLPSAGNRAQRNVTVRGNISFGWLGGAIEIGLSDANNVLITSNVVCSEDSDWALVEVEDFDPARADFSANAYYAEQPDDWFKMDRSRLNLPEWENEAREDDALNAMDLGFFDPSRDLGRYLHEIGYPRADEGWEVFLDEARRQRRIFYRWHYSADAVLRYIKEGFQTQQAQAE